MDKRILKTRSSIYAGFTEVMKEKKYQDITVEDILGMSGVSRSTFYAHFKTKNDVLYSVCDEIFDHVFSHSLKEEETHDFSRDSILDYSHLITHILYHLYDNDKIITSIITNSTRDIFYNEMRNRFKPIAKLIIQDANNEINSLPSEISMNKIIETFIIVVDYWIKNGYRETPEKITSYYFSLNVCKE